MGGFLVFLVFVAFSVLTSAAKRQQGSGRGQQPRWPGPVAPGSGYPRQVRPAGPPAARPPVAPHLAPPAAPAQWAAQAPLPEQHHEGPERESLFPAEGRRAHHLITDLHTAPSIDAPPPSAAPSPIQIALDNRDSLAQAIILSEVLGKPKALQGRTR